MSRGFFQKVRFKVVYTCIWLEYLAKFNTVVAPLILCNLTGWAPYKMISLVTWLKINYNCV